MAGRKEIPRELSIYINDVQVVNSFAGINRAIAQTNNEIRNLNRNSATYDEDLRRHQGTLEGLRDRQAEFREEINETSLSADKVKEAFSKMFTGLSTGNLAAAKEGFEEIKGSVQGLVKSALAFIATPLGAAIAVVVGIAAGTKAIFDFNEGLQKSNNLLQAFGVSGKEMSKVRSEIGATAESFDKEFEEIAGKANSLSKTFGISMSEANDIIARGLADGGAQNSEFLDSLGEYDEFFARAGYSATEFTNILNKGFDIGIYSDKLPDALKEADLSLKEQTKASREALTNAFGASFTDEILAKVTTGQITTKKALEDIAAKAKETGLTQQQNAQLTADVFRGAGEDAGGALKVLEAIGAATQKEMSESTKASLDLVAANEKLNKAQAELFEIENFGNIWTNIKSEAIDALGSILEWIIDVKKDIQPLIDYVGVVLVNAWINLKTTVQVAFDIIGGVIKYFVTSISTAFNFIAKLLKGDFAGALDVLKNGFIKLGNIVGDTFAKIKNHVIDGLKAIVSNIAPFLDAIGIDVDKIQKKLDSFKSKTVVLKTSSENGKPIDNPEATNTKATAEELAKQKAIRDAARQKEIDAHQKELDKKKAAQEKYAKELADKAIALAKAKMGEAQAELNNFIANNKSKIDSETKLNDEIVAAETKRLSNIYNKRQVALDLDFKNKKAQAEKEGKSAEEIAALKRIIDLDYETASLNLRDEFSKAKNDLDKQYFLQGKQDLLDEEAVLDQLAIALADTQKDEKLAKLIQSYHQEKNEYQALYDRKKLTKDQFDAFISASDKKYAAAEKAIKKQQVDWTKLTEDEKLNSIKSALNGASDALNKGSGAWKAVKIAETAIATYQSAVNSYNSLSGIPIVGPVLGGIAAAAAVASGIAQVKQITNTKIEKAPKFFYGGFNNSNGSGGPTGTIAHLGNDEYGKITGVTHDEEWIAPKVMTQSPKYAATFSWLENERKGISGNKFFDGGESSTGTVAPFVQGSTQNTDALLIAVNRLSNILDKGIVSKAVIGYKEAKEIKKLNDERETSNQYGIVNK